MEGSVLFEMMTEYSIFLWCRKLQVPVRRQKLKVAAKIPIIGTKTPDPLSGRGMCYVLGLEASLTEGNNHLTFTRCRRPNWRPFEIYSRELGEGLSDRRRVLSPDSWRRTPSGILASVLITEESTPWLLRISALVKSAWGTHTIKSEFKRLRLRSGFQHWCRGRRHEEGPSCARQRLVYHRNGPNHNYGSPLWTSIFSQLYDDGGIQWLYSKQFKGTEVR